MNRRMFLGSCAAAGVAAAQPGGLPKAPPPITDAERAARVEKARRLMKENRIEGVFLEPGSSLYYFTGKRTAESLLLPATGEPVWFGPGGRDIAKDPYKVMAGALKDRGVTARLAIEERVAFAVYDGLRQEAPGLDFVSADPVTVGCRVIKSAAEIALLQHANDLTIAAYRVALPAMKEGMTQGELSQSISAAFQGLGVTGSGMVSFGKFTAFPHGSIQPQQLREGDMVLVDGGCSYQGYQSDITRTTVFGKPTARQRQIWDLERKAQDAALAAAKPGVPCENVDAAARKVFTDAGFGPGYQTPGLPHRTGHGIGIDGHEWTNFVKGNKTPIRPGMCFSDEPTIVIYGEFGVRLEDCLYITEAGARMFTKQSPAIDQPFG